MNFEKFNIQKELNERRNFAMSITAKRNMGKSVLLRDLISQIGHWYSECYVFSQTARLQPDLFDFVASSFIIDGFDESVLNRIWKTQEESVLLMKSMNIKNIPRIIIIFDDVIGDPRIRNSKIFNNLFILGRHINLSVIVLSQEVGGRAGLPKVVRANLDIAIAFNLNSEYDRKLFVSQYLTTKSTKIGFEIINDICLVNYQVIVILNFLTSPEPEKYVRKYIASINIRKFKVGQKKDGILNLNPFKNLFIK